MLKALIIGMCSLLASCCQHHLTIMCVLLHTQCEESSLNHARFRKSLIWASFLLHYTGPEGTPYENGCFCFDIFIPMEYPEKPPKVKIVVVLLASVLLRWQA